MLFHVTINVHVPKEMPAAEFDTIKLAEKERAIELQKQGKWLHLWRVAGQYSSISVLDVADNDELHALLSSLPLFPYMTLDVKALAKHPSSLA